MKRTNRKWPGKFVAEQVAIAGVSKVCRDLVKTIALRRGCSQGAVVEEAVLMLSKQEILP
jgi:hypothetical protein